MLRFALLLAAVAIGMTSADSVKVASVTQTTSGETYAPGDLIFEDVFDSLDFETWQHEITMSGGGVSKTQLNYSSHKTLTIFFCMKLELGVPNLPQLSGEQLRQGWDSLCYAHFDR
jgi:hypothetical protein